MEVAMKSFVDGDQIVVTWDKFVNLQESPAVFIDAESPLGHTIVANGILAVAMYQLRALVLKLEAGGGELETQYCW